MTATGSTYAAYNPGATGEIHFSGGTLTTQSLRASPTQLTGTGTINAHGLVSDVDLLFDSAHGLSRTFTIDQTGQDVTVNLDLASNPSAMAIFARLAGQRFPNHSRRDIGTLEDRLHRLRFRLDGRGDGGRQRLEVDQQFAPLRRRLWQRNAEDHRRRARQQHDGYIGYYSGSTGMATVDGTGSKWTNTRSLTSATLAAGR